MNVEAEIARLQANIVRDKARDRRGRATDAAMHLRKAMELLEGCIEVTPRLTQVAALLCEATDLLTREDP